MGATFPRVTANLHIARPPTTDGVGPDEADPTWDDITWIDGHALHYDRTGKAINLRQWCACLNDPEYRLVLITDINENVRIVTAWNGVDINGLLDDNPPRIFGTIEVRRPETERQSFHDEESDVTQADAVATHYRRVSESKKELGMA